MGIFTVGVKEMHGCDYLRMKSSLKSDTIDSICFCSIFLFNSNSVKWWIEQIDIRISCFSETCLHLKLAVTRLAYKLITEFSSQIEINKRKERKIVRQLNLGEEDMSLGISDACALIHANENHFYEYVSCGCIFVPLCHPNSSSFLLLFHLPLTVQCMCAIWSDNTVIICGFSLQKTKHGNSMRKQNRNEKKYSKDK